MLELTCLKLPLIKNNWRIEIFCIFDVHLFLIILLMVFDEMQFVYLLLLNQLLCAAL